MPYVDPLARLSVLVSLVLAGLIVVRAHLAGVALRERAVWPAIAGWSGLALWQAWRAWHMQSPFMVQAAALPLLAWLTWRALRARPERSSPPPPTRE